MSFVVLSFHTISSNHKSTGFSCGGGGGGGRGGGMCV